MYALLYDRHVLFESYYPRRGIPIDKPKGHQIDKPAGLPPAYIPHIRTTQNVITNICYVGGRYVPSQIRGPPDMIRPDAVGFLSGDA